MLRCTLRGLLLAISVLYYLPLVPSLPPPPAASLLAFRRSLPRPSQLLLPWAAPANASAPASHCDWPGVTCFRSSPAVRALDLYAVGLSGRLAAGAPFICALPSLFRLDLSGNHFSGSIPPVLGNCSRLRVLLLNDNLLTGTIPQEIFSPRLSKLDLSRNSLSGAIPATVNSSANLLHAAFYNNFLSGEVPAELLLLPNLQVLYLNTNNFTGELPDFPRLCAISQLWIHENSLSGRLPRSLSNCRGLTALYASENNFGGTIPDIFWSLPALEYLHLDSNGLVGELPESLGNHENLSMLVLAENNLGGRIPEEIAGCYSMTTLNLGSNNFEGPIPASMGNLTRLIYLYLYDNILSGEVPARLGNCSSLVELELQNNFLRGEIPPEIGALRNLERLYLFNNSLEGSIPREIGRLSRLVELQLYSNRLSGRVPEEVTHLRNLSQLSLAHNNLVGELPSDLGKTTISGFVEIDLTGNDLHGPIPEGLCTGGQLTVLVIGDNRFNGSFPLEIGQCTSLNRVILSNNRLQGQLPSTLDQNHGISYLDIKGNLLEGHIPTALGSWYNLAKLDMSNNQFSGSVPRELGNLKNLSVLILSGNNLSGAIPSELGNCINLICLDLSRNFLSGPIPDRVLGLAKLQNLLLQENKLTGEIPDSFTSQQDLIELQLGVNLLEGSLPKKLGNLQQFYLVLNLSNNMLTGAVPATFGNLDKLQVIDLSNNSLSGEIPLQLGNMISLSFINVSFNQFFGNLPEKWMKIAATSPKCFLGNNFCIKGNNEKSCNAAREQHDHKLKKKMLLRIILCILFFLVGLCFILYLTFSNNCNWISHKLLVHEHESSKELPEDLRVEDLMRVTGDWNEQNRIGRGKHGAVYRMESGIGKQWAVKKVDLSEGSFAIEVKALSIVKHRNILRMSGYCVRDQVGFIIYEYMSGGTLFDLLHQHNPHIVLDWEVRHQIALGIAHGLSYLHHDCVPQIIHRDIKSENILMDCELNPRIGDFGTAKLVSCPDAGLTISSIIGTLGYIAPEIGFSTRINEKSDVYSYGVILLELLCRKMPVDPSFEGGIDIVTWTKMNMKQADECSPLFFLDEEISWWLEQEKENAVELLHLALSCTQLPCEARPSMREVVNSLTKMSY